MHLRPRLYEFLPPALPPCRRELAQPHAARTLNTHNLLWGHYRIDGCACKHKSPAAWLEESVLKVVQRVGRITEVVVENLGAG